MPSLARCIGGATFVALQLVVSVIVVAQQPLSAQSALSPRLETYPVLSPDGRFVVYASNVDGPLNLYRLDLTTREVVRLTNGDFEDSAPAWAPAGRTLVFQRETPDGDRDLWEIGADGANARNLTATPSVREQHPRYSPDGATVIFDSNRAAVEAGSDRGPEENYEIYAMSLADGALTRLTDWAGWDMYGSLSPDGSRLVWRRAIPGDSASAPNFELFIKDLGTGRETNLTSHPAYDGNPHWSPTGDWIVFISARDGAPDVYVVRPDGTGLRRITAGCGRLLSYARPSFSFDGTKILANRVIAGVTDIVVIEFNGDAEGRSRSPPEIHRSR